MKNQNIVRWGIIGCGDVTELKSGPAFQKSELSELIAVMRRNSELAKDYAQRHNVPKWYDDADALINDSEVDAVYIATPPSSHAEYAIKTMQAGKPVYVEKPMANSMAECEKMNQVSREKGIPLFVAYYRRALPGFLKVKELIEINAIGKPLTVNIRLYRQAFENEKDGTSWRVNPSIAGGGIFYDLASHQLDYLDFLFGPINNVYGIASNQANYYNAEDSVSCTFTFDNGVVGTGSWSFVTSEACAEDTMEIIGTEGKIVFAGFNTAPIKLITDKGTVEFPYQNPENIQFNLIEHINQAILNKTEAISTGETAIRTNRVLEEITKEYYK